MTKNIDRPRALLMLFSAAVLAAGLLALVGAKPSWAAGPNFAQFQNYPVGTNPTTVTNADFNGDGNVDLAAQNAGDNTVSVLPGNGDGTFLEKKDFAVGLGPTSVISADFNGDGKADLAVANWSSNNVSVLLGNGDGTFLEKKNFGARINPSSVTSAHFNDDNADGKVDSADFVDLAVANFTSDDVAVLFSNGDGTFKAPQPLSIRPPCPRTGVTPDCPAGLCFDFGCVRNPVVAGPNQVVAADLNRDGRADIATASVGDFECDALSPFFCRPIFIPGGVSVLLSNPDGTFQDAKRVKRDARTDSLTTEDINGDGKVDLVVTEFNSNVVSVLLGNGDGTFQTEQRFSVGTNPTAVTSADLNSDTKADLAVTNYSSDDVSVLFGNGSGSFQAAQNFKVGDGNGPVSDGPVFVTSAHFDDEGEVDFADLAVANQNSNSLSVLGPLPPPETTITSGPSGTVNSTSATFEFSSSEPGSTFQCALNNPSAYSACTSPQSYSSLSDGPHTFYVKATGGPGNKTDPTPATRTWTVDTTAPTVSSVSPGDQTQNAALSTSVEATFSEAMTSSTLTASTFTLRQQNSSTPVASTVTYDSTTKKATLDPSSNLASNTTYTAAIKGGSTGAKDLAGNALAADKVWTFTTTTAVPPETTITSGPSGTVNSRSATFEFTSTVSGSSFKCRVSGGVWGGGSWSTCQVPWNIGPSPDATYTFEVYAIDPAGNPDPTPASQSWTVDATAPTVGSVSPADAATNVALTANVTATFSEAMDSSSITDQTFTLSKQGSSSPLVAHISYDSANKKATLDPAVELEMNTSYTATIKSGTTGVKDEAGNALAADKVWTFTTLAPDTTAPETNITSGPIGTPVRSTTASFAFSANENGAAFECKLDDRAFESCTSPKEYTNLANGEHFFYVRATDSDGNTDDTPALWGWTIDTTIAPIIPHVTNTNPNNGDTGVARTIKPTVTFDTDLDPATVNPQNVKLQIYSTKMNRWVTISSTPSYDNRVITVTPTNTMGSQKRYRVVLNTNIESSTDMNLEQPFRFRFTTR